MGLRLCCTEPSAVAIGTKARIMIQKLRSFRIVTVVQSGNSRAATRAALTSVSGSGSIPSSSGLLRTTSQTIGTMATSAIAARMRCASRHPTSRNSSVTSGGMTKPPMEVPMVEMPTAKPRRPRNHFAARVWAASGPASRVPTAISVA